MRWFVDQLRMAEGILANALERAENFSEHDKLIISKIRREVDMADLTLLQLLSPIAPWWALGSEQMWYQYQKNTPKFRYTMLNSIFRMHILKQKVDILEWN